MLTSRNSFETGKLRQPSVVHCFTVSHDCVVSSVGANMTQAFLYLKKKLCNRSCVESWGQTNQYVDLGKRAINSRQQGSGFHLMWHTLCLNGPSFLRKVPHSREMTQKYSWGSHMGCLNSLRAKERWLKMLPYLLKRRVHWIILWELRTERRQFHPTILNSSSI